MEPDRPGRLPPLSELRKAFVQLGLQLADASVTGWVGSWVEGASASGLGRARLGASGVTGGKNVTRGCVILFFASGIAGLLVGCHEEDRPNVPGGMEWAGVVLVIGAWCTGEVAA